MEVLQRHPAVLHCADNLSQMMLPSSQEDLLGTPSTVHTAPGKTSEGLTTGTLSFQESIFHLGNQLFR